jgi:type II restriction enzyme
MTLLKSSDHTNFTYPLLSNSKNQPDPSQAFIDSMVFDKNLQLIDMQMKTILSNLLLSFHQGHHGHRLSELCKTLEIKNPLKIEVSQIPHFYKYKIKCFLVCLARGLSPSEIWTGQYQPHSGYKSITETGKLVTYYSHDKNQFEDYLFFNTQFEKPSTSRHHYGEIYQEGKDFFLKLNLQIRFIKH